MGKIASTLLTFLFSIPITAVGFIAIFGVPEIAQLNASPSEEVVIRDPYAQDPWGRPDNAHQNQFNNQVNSQQGGAAHQPNNQYGSAPQFQGASDSAPTWGQPASHQSQPLQQSQPDQSRNPFGHRLTNNPPAADMNRHATNTAVHLGESAPTHFAMNASPSESPANTSLASNSANTSNPFAFEPSANRPNTTETSAQMLTWAQASLRLSELGIKYHLERGDREGMFLFVCLYRPQENPQVTHRFEAEGNDPLVAVNLVINQVEEWLRQQYRGTHASNVSTF